MNIITPIYAFLLCSSLFLIGTPTKAQDIDPDAAYKTDYEDLFLEPESATITISGQAGQAGSVPSTAYSSYRIPVPYGMRLGYCVLKMTNGFNWLVFTSNTKYIAINSKIANPCPHKFVKGGLHPEYANHIGNKGGSSVKFEVVEIVEGKEWAFRIGDHSAFTAQLQECVDKYCNTTK